MFPYTLKESAQAPLKLLPTPQDKGLSQESFKNKALFPATEARTRTKKRELASARRQNEDCQEIKTDLHKRPNRTLFPDGEGGQSRKQQGSRFPTRQTQPLPVETQLPTRMINSAGRFNTWLDDIGKAEDFITGMCEDKLEDNASRRIETGRLRERGQKPEPRGGSPDRPGVGAPGRGGTDG